jgi:conjugal transfer/entry exclusion protein
MHVYEGAHARKQEMMRRLTYGSLCVAMFTLLTYHSASAQLPVIDATNLIQNTVQAVQSVLMVANMVLELTPLGEIVLSDTFESDMNDLGTIVKEAQGLAYDLSSLQAQVTTLFNLGTAPNNARELRQRLAQIRQVVFDCYVYALRTQTLIRTAVSTVQHLTRLLAAIGDLTGNMQSNQTLVQLESKLNEHLAQLQVQTAAYQHAQSIERLEEALTIESIQRINEAVMEDHPK